MPALADDPPLMPMPDSGSVTWGHWTFDYGIGDANEVGLVIKNVRWKGTLVMTRGSLPVIRVKYRGDGDSLGDGCGPWMDQIDSDALSFVTGQFTPVVSRQFSSNTLEIAVFAEIGGYDLYQAYYFKKSGRLEPRLYSSGWSCGEDGNELDHKHHPYWRLDFDVEGTKNEVWRIRTKNNGAVQNFKYPKEWNSWKESDDQKVEWTIGKPGSSKHVRVRYPDNGSRDAGTGSPWFGFSYKDMGVSRLLFFEKGRIIHDQSRFSLAPRPRMLMIDDHQRASHNSLNFKASISLSPRRNPLQYPQKPKIAGNVDVALKEWRYRLGLHGLASIAAGRHLRQSPMIEVGQ